MKENIENLIEELKNLRFRLVTYEKPKVEDCNIVHNAIKVIEENEKMKDENELFKKLKYQNDKQCIDYIRQNEQLKKYCEDLECENEKLKEECQKTYNQMMKVENYVQADITRLNEQLQHVRKVADVIQSKNKMIMNDNQMSAVEVLEWLNKNIINVTVMLEVFDGGWVSFNDILGRYEAQEIVDKITEYEKSNKFFNFDSPQVIKSIEKYVADTNVGEFKVGDLVKATLNDLIGYGTLEQIREDGSYYVKSMSGNYGWFVKDIEHAEPPKEEHTCKNCGNNKEYQPQHTCDECTSIDNYEEYTMWTLKTERQGEKCDTDNI